MDVLLSGELEYVWVIIDYPYQVPDESLVWYYMVPEHLENIESEEFPVDWEATRLTELEKLIEYSINNSDSGHFSDEWMEDITKLYPDWLTPVTRTIAVEEMTKTLQQMTPEDSKLLLGLPENELLELFTSFILVNPLRSSNTLPSANSDTDSEETHITSIKLDEPEPFVISKQTRQVNSMSQITATFAPLQSIDEIEEEQSDLFEWGIYPFASPLHDKKLIIGPNGTLICTEVYLKINWREQYRYITKTLLLEIFGNEILATRNLTGKLIQNFDEPDQLDLMKISDIAYLVSIKKDIPERVVRHAISKMCFVRHKPIER